MYIILWYRILFIFVLYVHSKQHNDADLSDIICSIDKNEDTLLVILP